MGIKERFSEYRSQTESLFNDLETALTKFEKTGDIKGLNQEFRKRINQFQKQINAD